MNLLDFFGKKNGTPPDAKIFPDTEYILRFDGCSKSNPGLAGAGAVIYKLNEEVHSLSTFVGENETNNTAEYTGLILGLKAALNMKITCIHVEGDSLLVINQMKGIYKVKSPNLIPLYQEAKQLEKHFDKVSYRHIYRENNTRADALSNLAVEFKE